MKTDELRVLYLTPFLDETLLKEDFTGPGPVLAWYMQDGLGSVRQLVVGKRVTNSYTYTAWGVPLNWDEDIVNRYTYTGREFNPESGNYHYRVREYVPTISRFLQRDPFAPAFYDYCCGHPTKFADPYGLWRIHRSKDNGWALAELEESDTAILISELAKAAELDADEAEKWLYIQETLYPAVPRPYRRGERLSRKYCYLVPNIMYLAMGSVEPEHMSKALPVLRALSRLLEKLGKTFDIPVLRMVSKIETKKDMEAFAIAWNTMSMERVQNYYEALGFKVKNAGRQTAQEILLQLRNNERLFGFWFIGHGGIGKFMVRCGNLGELLQRGTYIKATDREIFVFEFIDIHHELGEVVLNSCRSAAGPFLKAWLTSENGRFIGFKGIAYPVIPEPLEGARVVHHLIEYGVSQVKFLLDLVEFFRPH